MSVKSSISQESHTKNQNDDNNNNNADNNIASPSSTPYNVQAISDYGLTKAEKAARVKSIINHPSTTLDSFSHLDIKKIQRKMDLRLIPMLALLYLLSFLDRGNIGNAKIEGLVDDLNMTAGEYNIALTVFFFTYAAFEVPSNMLLKRLRPSVWLPTIMVAWGIVMTLMGIVQSYGGLLAARIFLGVAEAGLFPGVIYYNTMWYTRYEVQIRQAYFFSAASIAGAFSGLLAYGISFMDGIAGLEGWRWIFILEGILTVLVAVAAYFVIYDFPETASFLTVEERAFVAFRLKYDGQDVVEGEVGVRVPQNEKQDWGEVKKAFTDWQIYVNILVYWGYVCPLYGISLFLPTIINELGFSTANSQLLTVPPYIVASILTIIVAYYADRLRLRSPFIMVCLAFQLLGFIMCLAGQGHFAVTYAGVFLATSAIYPTHPTNLTWLSNNLSGTYKRAIGVAIQISLGNLAGAMASNFYRTPRDAPTYYLGHGLEVGFIVVGMGAVMVLVGGYRKENAARSKREEHEEEGGGGKKRWTAGELSLLGDRAVTFRYTL